MKPRNAKLAPTLAPDSTALDALAEALAPRVAAILLKQGAHDDGTDALAELLQGTGYELVKDGAA